MSSNNTVPRVTRAALTREVGIKTELTSDYPVKQVADLEPGECIIKIECTGVCHSDLHFMAGEWAIKPRLPSAGGHEGVGRILAIGAHTLNSPVNIGDRVGIKYVIDSCMHCEMCRRGHEQNCPSRKIAGAHVDGTFAEYTVAFVNHLIPIPDGFSSAEAAPILCAGVTVYNALTKLDTPPGSWIVIPGAGGGLGHLGIQYAVVKGLRVLAIDSGEGKRELCLSLGAEKYIDFAESKDIIADVKATCGELGAHAALITTASNTAYVQAGWYLRPHGTVLCVGVAQTVSGLPMARIIDVGIKYIGSMTGNRQAAREALELAARGKVRCHFTERPISEINSVLEDMSNGKLVGRVVLRY